MMNILSTLFVILLVGGSVVRDIVIPFIFMSLKYNPFSYETFRGEFPLSRNFYVHARVNFTPVNILKAMRERPRVSVKLAQLVRLRVAFRILPL